MFNLIKRLLQEKEVEEIRVDEEKIHIHMEDNCWSFDYDDETMSTLIKTRVGYVDISEEISFLQDKQNWYISDKLDFSNDISQYRFTKDNIYVIVSNIAYKYNLDNEVIKVMMIEMDFAQLVAANAYKEVAATAIGDAIEKIYNQNDIQKRLKEEEEIKNAREKMIKLQEENLIYIISVNQYGYFFCFRDDTSRVNYYSFYEDIAAEVIDKVLFPAWEELTPSDLNGLEILGGETNVKNNK